MLDTVDSIAFFLVLVAVGIWLYDLISFKQLKTNVQSRKKIPSLIEDFPTCNASIKSYLRSKNKVDLFSNAILNNQHQILLINAEDINNIISKGVVFDKYQPGKYYFYSILDNKILEQYLQWPALHRMENIRSLALEITFVKESDRILEIKKDLSVNNRQVSSKAIKSVLFYSHLLFKIFGYSQPPFAYQRDEVTTIEFQKITQVLRAVKDIKIEDDHLVIIA